MAQANATYAVKSWNRRRWEGDLTEVGGAHLFRLQMHNIYQGDIEGEGSVQYLITQNADGTGSFVALEKVIGSVGGRSGSFVFRHVGTFDNGQITETLTVTPGSGTGDLSGLSGQAVFEGDQHQERYPIMFDYGA